MVFAISIVPSVRVFLRTCVFWKTRKVALAQRLPLRGPVQPGLTNSGIVYSHTTVVIWDGATGDPVKPAKFLISRTLWKDTNREVPMQGYKFYWYDDVGGYQFVWTMPERRKDPTRITDDSIMNLARKVVGTHADLRGSLLSRLYCTIDPRDILLTHNLWKTRLDLTDIVKKDGNFIDWQFTRPRRRPCLRAVMDFGVQAHALPVGLHVTLWAC